MIKTKLFFDATPLIDTHMSGVGKVLQETLRVLDTPDYANRYDMYIFVPINEIKKARKLNYTYIKLKSLPYPHKFFSLFARLRFSPPIDIFLGKGVYVFENFRNWNLLFSKSITYIHDVSFRAYPNFVEERNLVYLQRHVEMWIDRTDRVVTVSRSSAKEISDEFGLKKVSVVSNAVDTTMFYPRSKDEVDEATRRWMFPAKYHVFIGNIEPRKNLINTIKAFRCYVRHASVDDSLVIIGGGGWRNEEIMYEIEQARLAGVNIIRPDGYVPDEDLPAIISGAQALLQFSWHEGFGLPVLQAVACGTPVAASDIISLREAAGQEVMVSYAPPDDIAKLAEAIGSAVEMGHRGEVPSSVRTWEMAARDLIEIVDEIS